MDSSSPAPDWSHADSRRSRVALLPSWDVFRIGGAQISLDASWLIVFGATAGIAAFFLLPWRWAGAFAEWPARPTGHWDLSHWAVGLIAGALFFGSILAHELAHFIRAARYGGTAPRVRLYVLGDIVETAYRPRSPRQEIAVALAGPVVSAVLGGVFVGLAWVLPERSIPQVTARLVGEFNLYVAVLSLLPGFPLDGGRLFHAVVWRRTNDLYRATRAASRLGMAISLLIGLWGCFALVFSYGLGSDLGLLFGPWALLVAWFLWSAASASLRDAGHRKRLSTAPVNSVIRSFTLAPFPHDASVQDVWQAIVNDRARPPCWAVADASGRITAWITRREVSDVPPDRRPETQLGEIVHAVDSAEVLESHAPLDTVLDDVQRDRRGFYVVKQDDRITGWVYAGDLVQGKRGGGTA